MKMKPLHSMAFVHSLESMKEATFEVYYVSRISAMHVELYLFFFSFYKSKRLALTVTPYAHKVKA